MCVDNRSWAVQSEAINSLAQIYRGCEYTMIYLADLVFELVGHETLGERLAECRWFKDIWTIPQIIFSRAAFFFSSDWTQIGTKLSLLPLLSSIIGIDSPVLEDSECLEDYSIARRMSWASEMTATRTEDSAYALLGLFDVSMPIIHGEGHKAFSKLQEEILKDTNDFSLFAWDSHVPQEYTGLFAPSPACFRRFKSGPMAPLRVDGEVHLHCAGITMQTPLWKSQTDWLLPLKSEHGSFCSIPLIPWGGCFVRKGSQVMWNLPGANRTETVRICVKRNLSVRVSRKISACEGIVSEKAFQSLRPIDDHNFETGPDRFNVDNNSEKATCSTAPAVETDRQIAFQHASTVSNRVTSHQDMTTDSEVTGCLSHQYEFNRLDVEAYQSLATNEDKKPMAPGLDAAPACMLTSDPISIMRSTKNIKTECSLSSAALSEIERHERPSCVHETMLKDCSISGSEMKVLGLPCNRSALDMTSVTAELADMTADRFLSRREGEKNKRSLIPWQTQSRKRVKRASSFDQLEGVYTSDSDDGETVLVKKARFLACPFYVRNNQYTNCLKRHHFDSIEDVKEHICWDHRRPKFCPICKEEFSSGTDRDAHIRLRACDATTSTTPDGITDDQEERLEKETESSLSEDTQWFQIWDIIFPQIAHPPSVFYSSKREVSICAFRQFWQQSGEETVASFLEANQYRSYNLENEERDLRTIYDLVRESVVDRIFEEFGDLINRR